jgi:hypothetical protein
MPRQQIGLVVGDVCKLVFDGFGDPSVECASRLDIVGTMAWTSSSRIEK